MKRFSLIICLCGLLLPVVAQQQRPKNQPYADMKRYHLGFHIGLHTQDLIMTHTGAVSPLGGETWYAEIPSYAPGLSVGVIGDMAVNNYINLRLTPTVHFGNKDFMFVEEKSGETFLTSVRSNYISLPLDIKYSSYRLNNFRPYMLGGVYAALDVGRKKGNPLLMRGLDYGIEIGFGCDTYMPFFKFCPEIKFCFGLADVLEKDRSDLVHEDDRKYTQAFSRMLTRMIVLTFNFE